MGKDLSGFKAPFLKKEKIRAAADEFRQAYWKESPPVDVEHIIEFGLGMEIVPLDGLRSQTSNDAFISANLRSIRIDSGIYSKPSYAYRVRFSLAHELGHLVLHGDIVPLITPTTPEEWLEIQQTIPAREYNYLELHAYEFAGRLLVPKGYLVEKLRAQKESLSKLYNEYPDIEDDLVAEYIAGCVVRDFDVTDDVLARRIKFEGILEELKKEL